MASKRMFAKSITNSSQFLMMPHSSQNLYFHLGMNADDDGFCEHFTIMRMTESKPDDLKILQAKEFVYVFDDKVLVIIDWKENNYIRSDRYTPSKYLEIYKEELRQIGSGVPNGVPAGDLDKVRLDKVRLDKGKKNITVEKNEKYLNISKGFYKLICDFAVGKYKPREPNWNNWNNDIRLMIERDNIEIEDIKKVMLWVVKDDFWNQNVKCPSKLRKHFDKLYNQMIVGNKKLVPQKKLKILNN